MPAFQRAEYRVAVALTHQTVPAARAGAPYAETRPHDQTERSGGPGRPRPDVSPQSGASGASPGERR
jgi:hypothetical protein